jgi:hypothetical protein
MASQDGRILRIEDADSTPDVHQRNPVAAHIGVVVARQLAMFAGFRARATAQRC